MRPGYGEYPPRSRPPSTQVFRPLACFLITIIDSWCSAYTEINASHQALGLSIIRNVMMNSTCGVWVHNNHCKAVSCKDIHGPEIVGNPLGYPSFFQGQKLSVEVHNRVQMSTRPFIGDNGERKLSDLG